jgi:ATP-dependent DNA helicase RecG
MDMKQPLVKLLKFMRLEADRGYDDRAIVGGLKKMLEPWQEEARSEGVSDAFIEVVVSRLDDYAHLSPKSRREALQGIIVRMRKELPEEEAIEDLPKFDSHSASASAASEKIPTKTEQLPVAAPEETPESSRVLSNPTEPEDEERSTIPATKAAEPAEGGGDESPPPSEEEESLEALEAPLTTIQGIGPKSAKTLAKLGLETLGDLFWYLPRRYDDYSQLETINRLWYGQEVTVIGAVESIDLRVVRSGKMKITEAIVSDGTGSLRVTWFNQPWIAKQLKPGKPIVLSGKVDQYLGRLTMNNPDWEPIERQQLHTNRIVPVYPLTSGVTNKWLRKVIHSVATRYAPRLPDPLPNSIRTSAELIPLNTAVQQIHFPDDSDHLHDAQHRLAFDEMFLLQLGVLRQKKEWEKLETEPIIVDDPFIEHFVASLPYELTPAQTRALEAIRDDLSSKTPMNRLLQGDVGSGKTVIAAAAMGVTAAAGSQSAIIAPTSILAEQHYQTLLTLLPENAGVKKDAIRLLIGATPEAEKAEIRAGLDDGTISVVIGTHALLEDPVTFQKLGLVIIDEQHRFGVEQRATLRAKGDNPNLLVMTATPIPRSLALTLYGDLDLTVLDELPPGRLPIETRVLRPQERTRAHSFITSQLEQGGQAFCIFPLVEGSEKVQTKAAVDEYEKLQKEVFTKFQVGLLHGRMRPDEKEQVMGEFREGELNVLVSTSVVEVGVDIPNATVMMVEGANHFGLAQLHQFRGRVGRGERKSYCLLIPDFDDGTDDERLTAMESTNDGFKLAEMDLDQRGPGDFLGTRQSGFAELRAARLTDVKLIEKARREATRLFQEDPDLHKPEHALLAQEMDRFWTEEKGEMS